MESLTTGPELENSQGHELDLAKHLRHVRFAPKSDRSADIE